MQYVDFYKKEQTNFMKLVKRKSNLTWKNIAASLKLTKGMVLHYHSGKSKIPLQNYLILCSLAKVPPKNKKTLEIRNKTKEIKSVNVNDERLAELLGILAGDGHISPINYEISITCHRLLDREYILNRVAILFTELFGVNAKIKEQFHNTTIKCVVNSKLLWNFLINNFNLPVGKKKNRLHVPINIFKDNQLLKLYLRGLFDTDGSIYVRRKKSIVVTIASVDYAYLEEIKKGFIKLGYNPSVSGKNLCIYDQSQVKRFWEEIGSSNHKHQQKYDNFIK